jgi:predicted PolB exonuclease-like 3'-5' exonuclease
MSKQEAAALVANLVDLTAQGYVLVTWNGLGFDLDILAEESGCLKDCAALAAGHVDMLFHAFCALGYPMSLEKAAEGMRLEGKAEGISGAVAPEMWAAGRYDEVLKYCAQDARLTLQIAETCEQTHFLAWRTQRGPIKQMPLRRGWLSVREAAALPLPDTSWMSAPISRDRFLGWVRKAGAL